MRCLEYFANLHRKPFAYLLAFNGDQSYGKLDDFTFYFVVIISSVKKWVLSDEQSFLCR